MMSTMSRTVGFTVVAQATQSKQTQKARLSAPKASFAKGAVLRTRAASAVSSSRQALSVRAGSKHPASSASHEQQTYST
eukprot:964269-Prorocentrum_minimum.AAC.2